MKWHTLLAIAASLSLSQPADGLSIGRRQEGLKVLGLETQRRAPRNPVHRDRLRKRGELPIGLDNEVRYALENGITVSDTAPLEHG
jgi:hypothetical protein